MDYFEISKLLEEARAECEKPVSNESVMTDWCEKCFNQGVSLMFNVALLKIWNAEKEGNKDA